MKIAQLAAIPFDCDANFSDMRDCATSPNQLFTTVEIAKAAAQADQNELLAEMDALDLADDLVWVLEADGTWYAESEAAGVAYFVFETELGA